MRITKIDAYRNDLSRVIVYFEDRSFLTVDARRAEELKLKPGMELDDAMRDTLAGQSGKSRARELAARIVGRNSISCSMLLRKLRDRGATEDDAQAALDWLISLGIMDDMRYGEILVSHYRARGFGNRRIREELRARGVPREVSDTLLADEPDMRDDILAFIYKRAPGGYPEEKLRAKITAALVRRGHSYEAISAAFRQLREDGGWDTQMEDE